MSPLYFHLEQPPHAHRLSYTGYLCELHADTSIPGTFACSYTFFFFFSLLASFAGSFVHFHISPPSGVQIIDCLQSV